MYNCIRWVSLLSSSRWNSLYLEESNQTDYISLCIDYTCISLHKQIKYCQWEQWIKIINVQETFLHDFSKIKFLNVCASSNTCVTSIQIWHTILKTEMGFSIILSLPKR